jgi:hypothetical protein
LQLDPASSSIGRPEAWSFSFEFFWMIEDWASGRSDGSDSPSHAASIIQVSCDTPPLAAGSFISQHLLLDPAKPSIERICSLVPRSGTGRGRGRKKIRERSDSSHIFLNKAKKKRAVKYNI